jgi:imidazole glycerol phosphate synthase glutamine amidotransferase subunit
MITVVDYGMGNLRNVRRAFESLGKEVVISASPEVIGRAAALILPGVGAFGEAVKRIDALGLRRAMLEHVAAERPLLGICLGMQLLFEESEESPGARGLGLFNGVVRRFGPGLHVPHIGWNDVLPARPSPLFPAEGGVFYFVHSYYAPATEWTVATTDYGLRYASAVQQRNVYGVQFHPEKSQQAGLGMLRRVIAAMGSHTSTTGPGPG